jgi:kinetochore protein Spc24, fungi type
LNTLSRSLAAQQSAYSLTTNTHNPAAHASEILRLDAEKFKIAKDADDAEISLDRCREDLRAAKIALEESSADGSDGRTVESRTGTGAQREREDDEMLLKLKVYRMLGIDVERDEATDEYVRAVVRNRKRGDVSVVNVDPKFSRFFYANWFWNQL